MSMEPLDAMYKMGYLEGICGIKKQPYNRDRGYTAGYKAGYNTRHQIYKEAKEKGMEVEIRLVPPDEVQELPDDMDSRVDPEGALALLKSAGVED